MARPLLLLLLLLSTARTSLASPRRRSASGRIVGGSPADILDFPWQLSVHYADEFWCGGSLLSQRWALTAARCVHDAAADLLRMRGGSNYRATGGVNRQVATGYVHRGWAPHSGDYDVAVLMALTPFSYFPELRPVSLPAAGFDPPAGLAATATGFGATGGSGALPIGLQRVDVIVSPRSACATALGSGRLTARMLCAGEPGRGFCAGDEGGPLVTSQGTQLGVASWASGDCQAPAVYASVGSVRQWIADVTGA